MVEFIPTEIPAPALLVVADEALVADAVKWRVRRRDADDGVGAPLLRTPAQLPHVHALRVADLPPYAVRALRHRMSVKRQFVVFLQLFKSNISIYILIEANTLAFNY